MIDDLDRTLERLLEREMPSELVDQITISFATPDDNFPPASDTSPASDMFLYDVKHTDNQLHQEYATTNGSSKDAATVQPKSGDRRYGWNVPTW